MSSLLENQAEKLKGIRKTFLWTAVCILIGEVVVGAILILTQSWDVMIGKLMGSFALVALVLFVGINNFIIMEKGDKITGALALVSFVANFVWLVLAILMIWEVTPFVWIETARRSGYYGSYTTSVTHLTVIAKIMLATVSVASAGFWTSNVLSIKETVKPVKPLKITAVFCELYCCIYSVLFTTFGMDQEVGLPSDWGRWSALSGLAGFAFVVTALAAWIISRTNKKKEEAAEAQQIQNNEQMQAAVREMVEKEVQERLAAEREKAERDAMPPLQSDDLPPEVRHDNSIKFDEFSTDQAAGGQVIIDEQSVGEQVVDEQPANEQVNNGEEGRI